MIGYSYKYVHKTKEVVIQVSVGGGPPLNAIMSAEAFTQDMEFIKSDQKLAHFLSVVKERKDLPIDHNFGEDEDIKFDPEAWEKRLKEGDNDRG